MVNVLCATASEKRVLAGSRLLSYTMPLARTERARDQTLDHVSSQAIHEHTPISSNFEV